MYRVILYYHFNQIDDPAIFCKLHKKFCKENGLLGRVYIAEEGINGTLAGKDQDVEAYKHYLRFLPGFEATEFKEETCSRIPFVKLIVKVRPEIVTLKASCEIDVNKEKGQYLSPQEWKKVLDDEKDIQLIDVRNDYESAIGHFEGAICPDASNFYDFEEWVEHTSLDKKRKVLMYCTGGIRCEKFSLLMEKKGFDQVYQLHGGIIRYSKEVGDAHYRGKCFVFDDRLTVPIEKDQKEPLTRCEITGEPCDSYLNCANPDCNRLFICSEEGAQRYEGCCCEKCMSTPKRRPFDPENIYEPTRKWYEYFEQKPTLERKASS